MPTPRVNADAREAGTRLRALRERLGLKTWRVAQALEMSTEGYRMYEVGRARIVSTDLPRFAMALGVSTETLVRSLGILDDEDLEPRTLTEDEQVELEELRRHPDLRVEFLNLARTFDELSDQDKRGLLEALRWMARSRGIPTTE